MISFKKIRGSASIARALLFSRLAMAQALTSATGSTDTYSNDFQKTFATGKSTPQARTAVGVGSTNIYTTDFQRVFLSNPEAKEVSLAMKAMGSIRNPRSTVS